MNKVQRFREVLNLLDNGSIIGLPYETGTRCAMSEVGEIGYCTVNEKGEFTEEILSVDYSYNNWLNTVSKGYRELYDNMFDVVDLASTPEVALCITTNGEIDKKGNAVMGKGNALEFKKLFPGIETKLAGYLKQYGNRAFYLGDYWLKMPNGSSAKIKILTCPTKHTWKENSDLTLITKSCEQLVEICNKFNIETCFLPIPGCGCGGLNYQTTVKPVLELTLDERFYVCFNS